MDSEEAKHLIPLSDSAGKHGPISAAILYPPADDTLMDGKGEPRAFASEVDIDQIRYVESMGAPRISSMAGQVGRGHTRRDRGEQGYLRTAD